MNCQTAAQAPTPANTQINAAPGESRSEGFEDRESFHDARRTTAAIRAKQKSNNLAEPPSGMLKVSVMRK
jgi:hypothetical protein